MLQVGKRKFARVTVIWLIFADAGRAKIVCRNYFEAVLTAGNAPYNAHLFTVWVSALAGSPGDGKKRS